MNGSVPWSEVQPDDIVEGSGGSLWAVDRIDEIDERGRTLRPRRVTMTHATSGEQRVGQPNPDKEVVVVVSAAEALEAAVAVTTVHLGGQDIGTRFEGPAPGQNEQGEWICPATFTHPGALMGHLYVLHGIHGSAVSNLHLTALERLHVEVHGVDRRTTVGRWVEHVHDPRYTQIRAERLASAS